MASKKELSGLNLRYTVKSDPYFAKKNKANFEAVKTALYDVGVYISLDDDELYISIMQDRYLRTKNRNAGRRKKIAASRDSHNNLFLWKYSDVVLMMQTMTDKEICEKIGMAIATYYRHKKNLKNTVYYKSLDKNKLNDKEYLESVEGNRAF